MKKVITMTSPGHCEDFTNSLGRLFQVIEKTWKNHWEDFFNILSPARGIPLTDKTG
jgi:hypothetical protein